jgi:hypothetical protein
MDARSDNLPPIFGAVSPGMPFSRMKPRILLSCSTDFAHIIKTSAIGAVEIQVFDPVIR